MNLEIQSGDERFTLHRGYAVWTSAPDGQMRPDSADGLYFRDTRILSRWSARIEGAAWRHLNSAAVSATVGVAYFANPRLHLADGKTVEPDILAMTVRRQLDAGLHEDIAVTNRGTSPATVELAFHIDGDFADIFEVKAKRIPARSGIARIWDAGKSELVLRYRREDFSRAVRVRVDAIAPSARYEDGAICFQFELMPHGAWRCCFKYDFADGDRWLLAPEACATEACTGTEAGDEAWQQQVASVEDGGGPFGSFYRQSVADFSALRLPPEDGEDESLVPAAGLPWFAALFGRDSLIASLQTSLIHPEFAGAIIRRLAKWQASTCDDYRDAQPGKIMHELRQGELAHFKEIPHTPYYGTADATPLYLITLHAAWMREGDRRLLEDHLDAAERCLEWIDKYGDCDGDGFQEYQTRSSSGLENQSWKDSGKAIVDAHGCDVAAPKALCEVQGYVYDAWIRMAHIYDALGRRKAAGRLRRKAQDLFDRFNAAFWDEELGTYVLALDADKRPARSVASNAGHCLWSGIVPRERAEKVAARLMQPDMFGRFGIRTLSSAHPSFNPLHYQVGAIWPHDNGLIAQGMKRYGLDDGVQRIALALTRAASVFERHQMPELYGDLAPMDATLPCRYSQANIPQAWAAGSCFSILQALLGCQPDAPRGVLYVDPCLPEWMPRLALRNFRFAGATLDIRFERNGARTEFEVLKGPSRMVRPRSMASWHEQLRAGES